MKADQLEKEFDKILAVEYASVSSSTAAAMKSLHVMAYLGKAIIRLDKTSARLVTITNILTGVMLIFTLVQVGIALYSFLLR
jgi:hypothetical protein